MRDNHNKYVKMLHIIIVHTLVQLWTLRNAASY